LLALEQFNQANSMRKLDEYRFLRARRIFKTAQWIDQMFLLHVFDHPVMKSAGQRKLKVYAGTSLATGGF
jgi:hypothetical protein